MIANRSAPAPSRGRIPGPRGLALLRFLVSMRNEPQQRLLELALEYGEYALLDFPRQQTLLITSPSGIEHVLHHRHASYDKQTPRWAGLRRIWGNGLLTADGDLWRGQRQRMQPAFHQDGVTQFAEIVVEEAERMGKIWHASALRGEPRDIYPDMLAVAVRAITRASFGSDVENKTDAITDALKEVQEFINPMAWHNLLDIPLWLHPFIHPGYRRFRAGYDVLTGVLREIVEQRRVDSERRDLLGMLMHAKDAKSEVMTRAQLYDEMMNMLMAGHETTGIATAWAWYWIAKYPDVQRQLQAEVDRVAGSRAPRFEDLPSLSYTRTVFEETLRITPPVWAYDRRAREEDEIEGYKISPGMFIALSPYIMHHHPRFWDKPDEFDPARFSPEQVARRPQYAYFPFGGGPRRCIGFRFAMLEGQLILAALAQSFTLRLKPGHPVEPIARLNYPPKYGVQMFLEPRRALNPAMA